LRQLLPIQPGLSPQQPGVALSAGRSRQPGGDAPRWRLDRSWRCRDGRAGQQRRPRAGNRAGFRDVGGHFALHHLHPVHGAERRAQQQHHDHRRRHPGAASARGIHGVPGHRLEYCRWRRQPLLRALPDIRCAASVDRLRTPGRLLCARRASGRAGCSLPASWPAAARCRPRRNNRTTGGMNLPGIRDQAVSNNIKAATEHAMPIVRNRGISGPRHLSLTILASLLPIAALADEPVALQQQVITATQTAHSELSAPASVSVVTREEPEKMPVYNLADAAKYLPGVHANPAPSYGRKAIKLRGMDSDYTLLLVNGRRVNSREALTSNYANDFDLSSIPMAAIERIEVIRGPMSSLYGADALGGVVNVILR